MISGAHLRLRRGVTLVELMIAMLILAIVCVAWLEIIGIQSAKREARRREAVERLAGMMDAFMYIKKTTTSGLENKSWYLTDESIDFGTTLNPISSSELEIEFTSVSYNPSNPTRHSFPDKLLHRYDDDPEQHNLLNLNPICYRLVVVKLSSVIGDQTKNNDLFDGKASSFDGTGSNAGNWTDKMWLVGLLYDSDDPNEKPFFRLPVCLGL